MLSYKIAILIPLLGPKMDPMTLDSYICSKMAVIGIFFTDFSMITAKKHFVSMVTFIATRIVIIFIPTASFHPTHHHHPNLIEYTSSSLSAGFGIVYSTLSMTTSSFSDPSNATEYPHFLKPQIITAGSTLPQASACYPLSHQDPTFSDRYLSIGLPIYVFSNVFFSIGVSLRL